MHEERAIKEFLGERPGAEELEDWRRTLEQRLESLEAELKKTGAGAAPVLQNKIAQLRRQIAALAEEEAVTRFVEDSVRVTLAMGAAYEAAGEVEE